MGAQSVFTGHGSMPVSKGQLSKSKTGQEWCDNIEMPPRNNKNTIRRKAVYVTHALKDI